MAKYEHVISVNLVIEKKTDEKPTHEEIKQAITKWIDENKEDFSEGIEWVDTEEIE